MKNFYLPLLTAFALTWATVTPASAQQAPSTTGRTQVGYAQPNDQIWEYDGLSLDFDSKVGCAIVLTKEMLKPYVGGTVKAMRVGWDTSESTGTYDGFVRSSFNGEDLSTGTATVRYNYSSSTPGWNTMTMTDYVIPEDVDSLVVGFFTNLTANVCAIPTLYPHNTPRSCFLWVDGDVDSQGYPHWIDMNDRGILPILLTIQDTEGTFNNVATITSLHHNGVIQTEEASSALVRIKNAGSQSIRNIEVTSRQGDQASSMQVNLSTAITPGASSGTVLVPLYCFRSGEVEFSITKVNGEENTSGQVFTIPMIGVPKNVAAQYTRRPLIEYYESENSYMSPRYYDDYVGPSIADKLDKFTYVSQHLDDQFMTGDDDATFLALLLADNDSNAVSIPAMSVDRAVNTDNILYQQNAAWNPMFSVLLEPYATQFFEATLKVPTFLSVIVEGEVAEDGETLTVTLDGDCTTGILPEGENARVTVYLMERDVESDSQLFWTEKEKEEFMGQYTHANVIREILTDRQGDMLQLDGGNGDDEGYSTITGTYTTTLDPAWNATNLYLVAFVHRDGAKGGRYMQLFNSAEGEIQGITGIRTVERNTTKAPAAIYDLQGRRISQLAKGVSIVGGRKILR
ncbi:MAG: Omp28-related outer membrane protein [Alloprevotella sp.]|nr:Omp28-related outer membrane protein [Alloprevotella sp.]